MKDNPHSVADFIRFLNLKSLRARTLESYLTWVTRIAKVYEDLWMHLQHSAQLFPDPRKSRKARNSPGMLPPPPSNGRAPSFLLDPNKSRRSSNTSSTNASLPTASPELNARTRSISPSSDSSPRCAFPFLARTCRRVSLSHSPFAAFPRASH